MQDEQNKHHGGRAGIAGRNKGDGLDSRHDWDRNAAHTSHISNQVAKKTITIVGWGFAVKSMDDLSNKQHFKKPPRPDFANVTCPRPTPPHRNTQPTTQNPDLKVLRLSNLTRSMRSSVCWNCSSVSPGKPTMTSPVIAASGASWKTARGWSRWSAGDREKTPQAEEGGSQRSEFHHLDDRDIEANQHKRASADTATNPLLPSQTAQVRAPHNHNNTHAP